MVKKTMVAMVVLLGGVLVPRAAVAGAPAIDPGDGQCTSQLADCYTAAAKIDNFWSRWAAGIDCELSYAGCVRDAILAD